MSSNTNQLLHALDPDSLDDEELEQLSIPVQSSPSCATLLSRRPDSAPPAVASSPSKKDAKKVDLPKCLQDVTMADLDRFRTRLEVHTGKGGDGKRKYVVHAILL
jgi:hypothetical protein